jgi:hypothetical protein
MGCSTYFHSSYVRSIYFQFLLAGVLPTSVLPMSVLAKSGFMVIYSTYVRSIYFCSTYVRIAANATFYLSPFYLLQSPLRHHHQHPSVAPAQLPSLT